MSNKKSTSYATRSNARRAVKKLHGDEIAERIDIPQIGEKFILPSTLSINELKKEIENEKEEVENEVPAGVPLHHIVNRSIVKKPCTMVAKIMAGMPGLKHKEYQELCENAGIATNTAKTQIQRNLKALKIMDAVDAPERRAEIIASRTDANNQ